jgi:hypothetical protein
MSRRIRYSYLLLRLSLAIAVLATFWVPHFLHFSIDRGAVPLDVLQESLRSPAPAVLDELYAMSLGVDLGIPDEKVVDVADQIISGVLPVPRFSEVPLTLQGYPRDYQNGPSTLQLIMASLEVERILLRAFDKTQDQKYWRLVLQRILGFAAHEERQRQAEGFLWNDHAVSARSSLLAGIWRHVQTMPEFPTSSSRAILSLIERTGHWLAKPSHFTVRTNHGVMQNLALLQIAAGFPALPEAETWRRLAIDRLRTQLPFYLSSEGFVLEHSAGYHQLGTELLARAIRLQFLNGLSPDTSLVASADEARRVLSTLMRPDGSLPLIGNTSGGGGLVIPLSEQNGSVPLRDLAPPRSSPQRASSLLPVSGYAIWWHPSGPEMSTQTVIAWAKHDGHGHKHADEGSVLFWSEGVDWLTNTGYWPYDVSGAEDAYSWTGSNAPHQLNESFNVERTAQLLATGETAGARFIELERHSQNGALFRRQVLQLDAKTLLVLDFAKAVPEGTETIWTIDPAIKLAPGATTNTFISTAAPDGQRLKISYANAGNAQLQVHHGSNQPFAGWVVVNNHPIPSSALRIVDSSPNSASATLFQVAEESVTNRQEIFLKPGAAAQEWEVSLSGGITARLGRQGSTITIVDGVSETDVVKTQTLTLQPPPDISTEQQALRATYARAISIYPPWRELTFYKERLTYAIGGLVLLLEIGLFIWSRRTRKETKINYVLAHTCLIIFWATLSVWIIEFYLV